MAQSSNSSPNSFTYAFCETFSAATERWHIRSLSPAGRKEGGGADTPALCGREVAWDLGPEDVAGTLARTYPGAPPLEEDFCSPCLDLYLEVAPPARAL